MKYLCALACTLTALSLAPQARAGNLFASSAAGGPGELYLLDPANGSMIQDIGPLSDTFGLNYPVTGLAFNPITGLLYGSTGNNPLATAAKLITINPATAQVTVIGAFNAGPVNPSGTPATMADIAFDSAGNLFGIGSIGGPQLYSINLLTGQATVIGSTGLTSTGGGGLAISPAGTMFGTPTSGRFGTYDSTGTFVNIANPVKPAGGAYGALSFDENGVLFGLNNGAGTPPPSHLVTINPEDGTVTDLGQSINQLDAIAFQPVPEPATLALLGLGVLAFCHRLRRQN